MFYIFNSQIQYADTSKDRALEHVWQQKGIDSQLKREIHNHCEKRGESTRVESK